MRTRRGHIEPRTRFFVGCEGESEQSYAGMLQRLCNEQGRHVHLAAEVLRGGDALARLEFVEGKMAQYESRGVFAAKFALLDADQRELSVERAARADSLARRLGILVVWQSPCHEGLLVKHFQGVPRQPQTAALAMEHLKLLWPEYHKAMTASELAGQIDHEAVVRAGNHIPTLASLLQTIGLNLFPQG